MNKLRIKNNDTYRIEVNDKGEYIEFDLNDIGIGARFLDALDDIKRIEKESNAKLEELRKQKTEDASLDSKIMRDFVTEEQKMFAEMRNAMDKVLGEGACQKIFGDRNYYEMYNDLIEELARPRKELHNKSHLDMIGAKRDNIHKRIMQKYKKNKEVTI